MQKTSDIITLLINRYHAGAVLESERIAIIAELLRTIRPRVQKCTQEVLAIALEKLKENLDPHACLEQIVKSIKDQDYPEAYHAATELAAWLHQGGAVPTIDAATLEFLLNQMAEFLKGASI